LYRADLVEDEAQVVGEASTDESDESCEGSIADFIVDNNTVEYSSTSSSESEAKFTAEESRLVYKRTKFIKLFPAIRYCTFYFL
jgi:hypothetical protein